MNRQFYEEELERRLSPNALVEHGFWPAFINLSMAYLSITGTRVLDELTFNTDLDVWNTILPMLTKNVDRILQYEDNGQDRLEEFTDLVDTLEYIFEEAITIQPKDLYYVGVLLDCDVFEALLNTDIEFRFIDADSCPSEVTIFIWTVERPDIAARQFINRVDTALFKLFPIYLRYPHVRMKDQISARIIIKRKNIYRSILFDYLDFEFMLEAQFDGSYTLYSSELPDRENATTIDYDTASNPRKLKAVMDRIIAM